MWESIPSETWRFRFEMWESLVGKVPVPKIGMGMIGEPKNLPIFETRSCFM